MRLAVSAGRLRAPNARVLPQRRAVAAHEPAEAKVARVRDRGEGHSGDGRSARERQRDEVYANNPDQPRDQPSDGCGHAKSALMTRHGAPSPRPGRSKPIPALLMKKRAPEPENA